MFSLCLYSVSLTTASAVAALALAVVVVGLSGGFLARLEVRYAFENVRRVDDIFHLQVLKHALLRMHEAVSLDSGSTQFSLGGSLFCRRKGSGL